VRPLALALALMSMAAWAGPALDGVFGAKEMGQLQLSTSPNGDITGRFKKGGACAFKADEQILEGSWQGDVFVGHLNVCTTGSGCASPSRVPFMGLWFKDTLVGDVKLPRGCHSPGLPDDRFELASSGASSPPEDHPKNPEQQATRKLTEKEREAERARLLALGVEQVNRQQWHAAHATFTSAIEEGVHNSLVYMGLGVTQVRMGESVAGMESLNQSVKLAKDEKNNAVLGQAYFNLACAYASQGKQTDALNNLRLASKLIPARDLEVALDKEKDLDSLKDTSEYHSIAGQVHLDAAKPQKKQK
jgi:hypothetical protein